MTVPADPETRRPGWLARVAGWFGRSGTAAPDPARVQAVKEVFRARCLSFKLLLAANNRALEVMSDMEEALRGGRPFGVGDVRTLCVRVVAAVHQMIQRLAELTGGRWPDLEPRFQDIRSYIEAAVAPRREAAPGPLVLDLAETGLNLMDEVGSKVAMLGELGRAGLPVPEGFAVTASGFRRFFRHAGLQEAIDRMIQVAQPEELDESLALSSRIRMAILRAELPPDLEQGILERYDHMAERLGRAPRVAVRSSALGEDLLGASFAGQYHSELNVGRESLVDVYREVVASKYGLTAMTYRFNRGIPDDAVDMCVGVMEMVDAVAGGVCYTRNPVNPRDDTVMIDAVPGLPKSVVDGSVDTDVFAVARREPPEIVRRRIAAKTCRYDCEPDEGVRRRDLAGDEAAAPSLDDGRVLELARLAMAVETHFGAPQDIEWAVARDGRLVLLQSRPLHRREGGDEAADDPLRRGELPEGVVLAAGVTASPGVGAGPVHPVRRDVDALTFPEGGVLVAAQALPAWAALLGRAAAVVTEHGSVAGHLANVAREFRVPALFGAAGALEVLGGLDQGETVTVDADGRMVHRGRVEALLAARAEEPVNLMRGSKVYEMLQDAAEHVVKLNLLDPDALDFRPGACRTLHDVTRFCHEMSVREMFSAKNAPELAAHACKQLYHNVPMQYFLIDLDGGFTQEIPGKYVQIKYIASKPMLALWRGMTRIPTEGAMHLDAKGFMSVMLEAATNPELDPALPNTMNVSNYFMLSRDFVSLQARLGFHFCTVEANAGPQDSQNYVSFQFKGGAADMERRVRRARFVGWVLEEYGLRVEVRQDALFARMEGVAEAVILSRLVVLGYLIMHTRQLDMIMLNEGLFSARRDKILSDLKMLVANEAG